MKMLRSWVVAMCAFLVTIPASAKDKNTKLSFEFSGHARVLYVVVPEKQSPMPVVVLLHGSGRNGEIMAQAWRDLAAREGFIVHPVDESRIYLFGHSALAAYALFLAVMDSGLFAATAIHAGALQANPDGLFEQVDRKMPIAIWVGDRDPNFPVDVVEATRRLYATNGYQIKLNLIPNHDHNYYVISDQVDAKAWDFLKNVRMPPAQPEAAPTAAAPSNP